MVLFFASLCFPSLTEPQLTGVSDAFVRDHERSVDAYYPRHSVSMLGTARLKLRRLAGRERAGDCRLEIADSEVTSLRETTRIRD